MAIVYVTKMNFSKVLSEKIDEMEGGMGIFASALLGGKEKIREALADVPDEQGLWVNTDYVSVVSAPIKISETGDVVFRIYFRYTESKDEPIWLKGDDYKKFILAWSGEEKYLNEVEYKVSEGCFAISIEDGTKVRVVCVEKENEKKNEDSI